MKPLNERVAQALYEQANPGSERPWDSLGSLSAEPWEVKAQAVLGALGLEGLTATGDTLQSAGSRIAEWILAFADTRIMAIPYEVRMAALETRDAVSDWTYSRVGFDHLEDFCADCGEPHRRHIGNAVDGFRCPPLHKDGSLQDPAGAAFNAGGKS